MAYATATQVLGSICHDVANVDQSADVDYLLRDYTVKAQLPADASAATDTTYVLMVAPKALSLVTVTLVPSAAVLTDPSDYVTFTLGYDDGVGGAPTSLDAFDTAVAGLTERVPVSFAVTVADQLTAGVCLTLAVVKSGSGKVVPDLEVVTHYRLL